MKKTEIVCIRMTEGERRVLNLLARREEWSASEMLRDLVRREAKDRGLWPATVEPVQAQPHVEVNLSHIPISSAAC